MKSRSAIASGPGDEVLENWRALPPKMQLLMKKIVFSRELWTSYGRLSDVARAIPEKLKVGQD